jgi:CheY-like chemotaxis protein
VLEATTGVQGLIMARAERPRAILLDLAIADLNGFEVLDRLEADAATRDIPVIVVSSRILSRQELDSLVHRTLAIISKESPSRHEVMAAIRKALFQTEPRRESNPEKTKHA